MTPNVTLRRASSGDAEQVAAWRAEPAVRAFQPLNQHPVPLLRAMLTQRGTRPIEPTADSKFQWIVQTGDGDAGWVTVTILNREHGIGALGYTITSRLHRRGYGAAAVRAVLPIVFASDALNLFRLEAVAAVANIASRRVLESNGFQFEGIVPGLLRINDVLVDHARYALTRPQWLQHRAAEKPADQENEEELKPA